METSPERSRGQLEVALGSKSQCGGSAMHRSALEQCEGVVPSALLPETLPAASCSALGPQHQRDRVRDSPALTGNQSTSQCCPNSS